MKVSGNDLFVTAMKKEGVDTIFAYPGGMVVNLDSRSGWLCQSNRQGWCMFSNQWTGCYELSNRNCYSKL